MGPDPRMTLPDDIDLTQDTVCKLATALAQQLRAALAPIGVESVTLKREDAVMTMAILEGVAVRLSEEREG
jgi:hypothetical protein